MKISYFIAKRLAFSKQKSFSRLIIRIAAAAVALSVAVMIISTALVNGFQKEISSKMFGFWGHIQITRYDRNYSFESSPVSSRQPFYPSIDTMPGVRHIQQFATKPGIIKTGRQFEGVVLKGIAADFDWSFIRRYLVAGDTLTLRPDTMSYGIIVSKTSARRLGLAPGDRLTVDFIDPNTLRVRARRFTVTGIYHTGLAESDKLFALVDIRQIQRLNGWNNGEVGGFEIFLDDVRNLDEMGIKIYRMMPPELNAITVKQIKPNLFDWLELQSTNEQVILVLMLLVATINMITALLILILERTNMIGILKALGASNWSIRKIFLYQAAYIIIAGMLIGNAIGLGLTWLQWKFSLITLPEETYYVSVAPVSLDPLHVLLINLITLAVCLFFLLLPSYLVSRIRPIRAIRFD